MPGQIDEIKARIDIVELISEYIRLKPAGPNNWKALCPFHNEKTPSFLVSKDKQIWHCFGCGEGGDILTFVEKMENVEFVEALRTLAQKAGVKLVAQDPKLTSQKNRLMDICQLAGRFWHQTLLESSSGEKAREYLNRRGVKDQTIGDFKIGYASDSWDELINFLKERKFNDQDIFLAGLSVKKERGEGFYDRFRDRLMFPINDLHGNTVGFSGRTLKLDEKAGKYINTPQTLIYNKSLVLFNLDQAKNEIKKQDLAIVVEGQMDVVSAVQAGTRNVIASSGTALTVDQLKIIKRYSNNLAMAFDADLAGQQAAKRGIDLALAEEMNVRVVVLPGGKDPDACIRNNPADWFSALGNAKSIMDYYFEQTFAKLDLTLVEDKKQAARELLPMIVKIANTIEQTHWLQQLANRLNVSENILRESLPKTDTPRAARSVSPQVNQAKDRSLLLAERILGIVLKYPDNLNYLIDNFSPELISDQSLQNLYKQLIVYYTENIKSDVKNFDYSGFNSNLSDQKSGQLADKLVLLAENDFFDFDAELVRRELNQAINFAKKAFYTKALKEIEGKIKQAENSQQKDQVKELSAEFNELLNKLNFLE